VRVFVNGAEQLPSPASGAPITITVPTSPSFIKVYGDPAATTNIGLITLNGSIAFGTDASIGVLIGNLGAFPGESTDPLSNAGLHWAGITIDPASPTLNDRVKVAGAISGDLTGPITVGQVFSLHVDGDVDASITATGSDNLPLEPIETIRIGKALKAGRTILATGGPFQNGDIVSVHTALIDYEAVSQGSILAPNGEIREVFASTISIPAPGSITARDGITSLIVQNQVDLSPRDINATIIANAGNEGAPAFGQLRYLECRDLGGSLRANNLGSAIASNQGLRVKGDLYAAIRLENSTLAEITVDGSFGGGSSLDVGDCIRASVVANGSITAINVENDIFDGDRSDGTPVPTRIQSLQGGIDSITVHGGVLNDSMQPGPEVEVMTYGGLGSLVVDHDFFGNIIVGTDSVAGPQALGTLLVHGDFGGSVYCDSFGSFDVGGHADVSIPGDFLSFEAFPAGKTLRVGRKLGVPIVVFDAYGGQAIINAANETFDAWRSGAQFFIHPTPSGLALLAPIPFYDNESHLFGGGAVGQVPFALHGKNCFPPNNSPYENTQLLVSRMRATPPPGLLPQIGLLDSYGQVRVTTEGEVPCKAELVTGAAAFDLTDRFVFTVAEPGDSPSRIITFRGKTGFTLPPGDYRITPVLGTGSGLVCDNLTITPPPSVADFDYRFALGRDCDGDGKWDDKEIALREEPDANEDGIIDTCPGNGGCRADYNFDGDTGTDQDIEDFFACLGGNCCATCYTTDFDGDGDSGTDLDIEAFFRVLGGGLC